MRLRMFTWPVLHWTSWCRRLSHSGGASRTHCLALFPPARMHSLRATHFATSLINPSHDLDMRGRGHGPSAGGWFPPPRSPSHPFWCAYEFELCLGSIRKTKNNNNRRVVVVATQRHHQERRPPARPPGLRGSPSMATREDRRVVLWPAFIDAALTCKEGRRVGKAEAVAAPGIAAMRDSCTRLGFAADLEPGKKYPRDVYTRGRVLVRFFEADGTTPVHREIRTRRQLLRAIVRLIPQDPGGRGGDQAEASAKKQREGAKAAKKPASGSKKGKKKKGKR